MKPTSYRNNHDKTDPLTLFSRLYKEHLKASALELPGACCLSTAGLDGFPNARYVSLKEVKKEGLLITGSTSSIKGIEIESSNKVALTFWWPDIEYQVRIQGLASKIPGKLADRLFRERPLEARIVSLISRQSEEINYPESLEKELEAARINHEKKGVRRPENWGGYFVKPLRMEFLQFKSSRLHVRKFYQVHNNEWTFSFLQP
ncbi:MAG TPA: pyridoxal 5'-phosphate synthase [Flavisolibacter sp.]